MQEFSQFALSTLMPGRQHYRVSVPGTAAAAQLSVISFEAVEALGEPYRIAIALTHPETLDRADFLGKPAAFHIGYPDSVLDARTTAWLFAGVSPVALCALGHIDRRPTA